MKRLFLWLAGFAVLCLLRAIKASEDPEIRLFHRRQYPIGKHYHVDEDGRVEVTPIDWSKNREPS